MSTKNILNTVIETPWIVQKTDEKYEENANVLPKHWLIDKDGKYNYQKQLRFVGNTKPIDNFTSYEMSTPSEHSNGPKSDPYWYSLSCGFLTLLPPGNLKTDPKLPILTKGPLNAKRPKFKVYPNVSPQAMQAPDYLQNSKDSQIIKSLQETINLMAKGLAWAHKRGKNPNELNCSQRNKPFYAQKQLILEEMNAYLEENNDENDFIEDISSDLVNDYILEFPKPASYYRARNHTKKKNAMRFSTNRFLDRKKRMASSDNDGKTRIPFCEDIGKKYGDEDENEEEDDYYNKEIVKQTIKESICIHNNNRFTNWDSLIGFIPEEDNPNDIKDFVKCKECYGIIGCVHERYIKEEKDYSHWTFKYNDGAYCKICSAFITSDLTTDKSKALSETYSPEIIKSFQIAIQYLGQILNKPYAVLETINTVYYKPILDSFLEYMSFLSQSVSGQNNDLLVLYMVDFLILYVILIIPRGIFPPVFLKNQPGVKLENLNRQDFVNVINSELSSMTEALKNVNAVINNFTRISFHELIIKDFKQKSSQENVQSKNPKGSKIKKDARLETLTFESGDLEKNMKEKWGMSEKSFKETFTGIQLYPESAKEMKIVSNVRSISSAHGESYEISSFSVPLSGMSSISDLSQNEIEKEGKEKDEENLMYENLLEIATTFGESGNGGWPKYESQAPFRLPEDGHFIRKKHMQDDNTLGGHLDAIAELEGGKPKKAKKPGIEDIKLPDLPKNAESYKSKIEVEDQIKGENKKKETIDEKFMDMASISMHKGDDVPLQLFFSEDCFMHEWDWYADKVKCKICDLLLDDIKEVKDDDENEKKRQAKVLLSSITEIAASAWADRCPFSTDNLLILHEIESYNDDNNDDNEILTETKKQKEKIKDCYACGYPNITPETLAKFGSQLFYSFNSEFVDPNCNNNPWSEIDGKNPYGASIPISQKKNELIGMKTNNIIDTLSNKLLSYKKDPALLLLIFKSIFKTHSREMAYKIDKITNFNEAAQYVIDNRISLNELIPYCFAWERNDKVPMQDTILVDDIVWQSGPDFSVPSALLDPIEFIENSEAKKNDGTEPMGDSPEGGESDGEPEMEDVYEDDEYDI